MVDEQEVADFLLRRKFFLTALEFHQELKEEQTNEIPANLQTVFAALPEKESIEDLDTHFSKGVSEHPPKPDTPTDGGNKPVHTDSAVLEQLSKLKQQIQEKEEKIQVLEYNLRKSTETVDSLRSQMTAAQVGNTDEAGVEAVKLARDLEAVENMKIHEKRTLNFLIKNFLVAVGYKLTAITFSDEVSDQDLDTWSDVGLNCSTPPSLLSFYRYFYNAGPNQYLSKIEEEANIYKKKAAKWKARGKRIPELEAQIHELKMTIKFEKERKDKPSIKKENEDIVDSTDNSQQSESKQIEEESKSVTETIAAKIDSQKRKFRFAEMKLPEIRKIAWIEENSSIAEQIKQVSVLGKQEQGPVLVLGESLPIVTRSVLLKARKDLLPMLLIAIQQHPEPKVRDPLTNLLFNLIKKPDEQQRQMIIIGCVALARLIGKERTEGELLPQCWEQISSKYEERRVLVAESCGALAAYSKSSMRVSLIMSMLVQLLDDKSVLVREAVVKNLAQLISYFEDKEKYSKVEELLLKLFYDPERQVVDSVKNVLVPVFMEWSQMLGLLLTRFMPLFTDEMAKLLKNMDPGRINESDVSRVETLFDIILNAIPHMTASIFTHSPLDPGPPADKQIVTAPVSSHTNEENEDSFGSTFGIKDKGTLLDKKQKETLLKSFDSYLAERIDSNNKSSEMWEEWNWFANDYLTNFIQIICRSQSLESPRIANGVSVVISRLCSTFGETFTHKIVRNKFLDVLLKERCFFKSAKELENARKRATPVYLLGVMTAFKDTELIQALKEFILNIAEGTDGWGTEHFAMIKDSIRLLCTSTNKTDKVVTLLTRDLVAGGSVDVRIVIVRLYEDIMLFLSASDLENKLFPALITLSSDVSPNVRLATVKQLCNVARIVTQKPLIEKIDLQFEFLLTDNGHDILAEVLREFIQLIPHATSIFRELCILPKLIKIVDINNHTTNEQQRQAGCKLIIDAYRAFNGTVITEETIQMYILPGLRLLHANSKSLDPTLMATVARMISDMERAIGATSASTPKLAAKEDDKKKRWRR